MKIFGRWLGQRAATAAPGTADGAQAARGIRDGAAAVLQGSTELAVESAAGTPVAVAPALGALTGYQRDPAFQNFQHKLHHPPTTAKTRRLQLAGYDAVTTREGKK